ncbi:MAG: 30S ribosomal protein S1 [Ruminococcaceae bacterium]|nr:30S ribosomal protein S1 [Oscillospiraceae bacterium]
MINYYLPEGRLLGTKENYEYISSEEGLRAAQREGKILEATVLLCDSSLCLHLDLCGMTGIIEKDEALLCREGERPKDIAIITRVGKPVCFKVLSVSRENGHTVARLSRRLAQEDCAKTRLSRLRCGDLIPATVTHLESFGAFVDIGCGISSLLSVDSISVSRISHPSDRLSVGDRIHTVVKSIDADGRRIFVSMRELLGTWEENAAMFEAGQTVAGVVRSIESYGVFIELAPNLAGLAEIRNGTKDNDIAVVGNYVAVYIKSIIPERMKIKLVLIDSYRGDIPSKKPRYFTDVSTVKHLDFWRYSPYGAPKIIESVFS